MTDDYMEIVETAEIYILCCFIKFYKMEYLYENRHVIAAITAAIISESGIGIIRVSGERCSYNRR